MEYNAISTFISENFKLVNLKILNLSKNKLHYSQIDQLILRAPQLEVLNLGYNDLKITEDTNNE